MKSNRLTPYLFLTPFVLGFGIFFILPVLYSVYLSFLTTIRKGFSPPVEVFGGFANYARAFTDGDFLASFGNILIFGLIQVPIMLGFATVFALIIDETAGRLNKIFRTAIYIPYTLPGVIAGLLWGFLYSKNLSPLNYSLVSSGRNPIDFLNSSLLLFSIGNIITWTWTGYNSITLYANLQNVSRELYEAAAIDGATGWNVIRYIKLPLLRPALMLTLIFSVIGAPETPPSTSLTVPPDAPNRAAKAPGLLRK